MKDELPPRRARPSRPAYIQLYMYMFFCTWAGFPATARTVPRGRGAPAHAHASRYDSGYTHRTANESRHMAAFNGLTAEHRSRFRAEGYVVFERAIPNPLLLRLRSVADVARTGL